RTTIGQAIPRADSSREGYQTAGLARRSAACGRRSWQQHETAPLAARRSTELRRSTSRSRLACSMFMEALGPQPCFRGSNVAEFRQVPDDTGTTREDAGLEFERHEDVVRDVELRAEAVPACGNKSKSRVVGGMAEHHDRSETAAAALIETCVDQL